MTVWTLLQTLRHDASSVLRALVRIASNDWRHDDVDVCFASLHAQRALARPGEWAVYRARLMNPRRRHGLVRLVFDFNHIAEPGRALQHLGFGCADVELQGRFVHELELRFDWLGGGELAMDDGRAPRAVPLEKVAAEGARSGLWQITWIAREQTRDSDWHSLEILQRLEEPAPCV